MQQRPAVKMEDLLAKSAKNRLLSVVVRLRVDTPKDQARSSVIKAAQEKLQNGLSGTGFKVKRLFRHIPFATLEVDPAALRRLATLDVVAGVSEEGEYYPQLEQTTQLVDAPWSFRQTFSGKGAAVAILDGGVVPHSFFGNRLVEEFCFSSPGWGVESLCRSGASEDSGPGAACTSPIYCDHGTHVTGIAAGDGGIAREASIIAINASVKKTFLLSAYQVFLNGDIVAGLEKVLDLAESRHVAAVNMSFGGLPYSEDPCDSHSENEQAISAVVELLKDAGVAAVAASGNDGEKNMMSSPACISSVISVGATDDERVVAEFSNSSNGLDFLAPGIDVRSSVPGGFEEFGGTSMAAPHVTGAWAVLKAKNALARVNDVATALGQSGLEITDDRQERQTPMIQMEEAMQLILQPQVRIYPANGVYQTPLDVQIHVLQPAGLARNLKTWVTTNGEAPEEGAPGSSLLCEAYHCDFHVLTLDQPSSPVIVQAKTFFSLLDGTRLPAGGAGALYVLREPAPGPVSVTASDGTFPDHVHVTWTAVPGAEGYEVFGSVSDRMPGPFSHPLNATRVTETFFDHLTTVGTGEFFYYFVRAEVDGLPSLFGGPDTGYSKVASIPVQASDGTQAGRIHLTWDPIPWKTPGLHVVYEIYRSTDTALNHATLIATREGRFVNNYPAGVVIEAAPREYLDANVVTNQTYFYWVKGIDGADISRVEGVEGEGGFSGP